MFEKMGNRQEDESFLIAGQIEVDIALRREKRKEEQEGLISNLKEMLKERDINDLDLLQEFSQWQKTEQDIVSEIEDPNEYVEGQINYQIKEAEIFAETGLKYQRRDLIRKAIELLDGTDEFKREDGALFSAERQVENGVLDGKIAKAIDERVEELLRAYKSIKS